MSVLKDCHKEALQNVREYSLGRQKKCEEMLRHLLEMSNVSSSDFESALEKARANAGICLHFHPDRICSSGSSVADSLLADGIYRNQFETGISAGGLSAMKGGHRDRWEQRLFGGAYHWDGCEFSDRPKYGALNLFRAEDGAAPRFGCCYLVLRPEVCKRSTFTYYDSHLDPPQKGTWDAMADIWCALYTEVFERNFALGVSGIDCEELVGILSGIRDLPSGPTRNLDHYVETQVHGPIRLEQDVVRMVADPSFKETSIGAKLEQLAQKHRFKLTWHGGFYLLPERVPHNFRGPLMPTLARAIADKPVTARTIGEAAAGLSQNPQPLQEFGTAAEVTQHLKRLWHVLVKYGEWTNC